MPSGRRPKTTEEIHRLTVRLTQKDFERLSYWAEKKGYDINSFIILLLDRYIDIENGNYQLPTLEVQRLNQMVESMAVMSRNMQSLEMVVTSGFDSLLGLTRGDNYLVEATDEGV